jgi:outer membrane translocation and assembly module TamA
MHILVRFLVVFFLTNAALGQPRFAESADNIRVSKLVIESNSLPDADRERIIRLFQQKTYCQAEIGERIRGALRNLGYFKAVVDEPRFSYPTQVEGRRGANLTVRAEPGAQYRIGQIHFQKTTIFPPAELRNLFSLRRGDLFNATKIGEGLEDMRKLYGTQGYINLVAVPEIVSHESRHIIDLVVEVDEGKPYDFGRLDLEGVEPYAGAGKSLLNSWKTLEGKRYSPLELQHWLLANHSDWNVGTRISDSMRMAEDPESLVVNMKLTQWPD